MSQPTAKDLIAEASEQRKRELYEPVLVRLFQTYDEDESGTLEANEIPCGPINDYHEVMNDPHVRARDMVIETDHPSLGRIKTLGTPIKMSESPLAPGRPAPLLGQHTDEVLRQAGYNDEELTAFRNEGAIR